MLQRSKIGREVSYTFSRNLQELSLEAWPSRERKKPLHLMTFEMGLKTVVNGYRVGEEVEHEGHLKSGPPERFFRRSETSCVSEG